MHSPKLHSINFDGIDKYYSFKTAKSNLNSFKKLYILKTVQNLKTNLKLQFGIEINMKGLEISMRSNQLTNNAVKPYNLL